MLVLRMIETEKLRLDKNIGIFFIIDMLNRVVNINCCFTCLSHISTFFKMTVKAFSFSTKNKIKREADI